MQVVSLPSVSMPSQSESITVDDTAGGTSLSAPSKARTASIQVLTANIRFWTDGGTPTTSAGIRAGDGDWILLSTPDEISGFKAIREGSTSATLQVTYG